MDFHVRIGFLKPPLSAGFGNYKISATLMPVPETTMNKDYSFVFWKDNIRFSG